MQYIRALLAVAAVYALHVGCSALSTAGWPPALLPIFTVLAVWWGRSQWVAYVMLPAALLVDVTYAQQLPITTTSVLVCLGVTTIVQRGWLTNHSSIALVGLGVLGLSAAHATHVIVQVIAHASGLSVADVREAWAGWYSLRLFLVECVILLLIGVGSQVLRRLLSRRFLYATH